MSGIFIFTPDIFPVIEELLTNRTMGEISDRTALREAQSRGQEVTGVIIEGKTYDTGYPEGYARAVTAFLASR